MASVEIIFDAKTYVQAAKMQQQFVNQMKPLGYTLDNLEMQPISEKKIKTKITMIYQKNKTP